MEFYEFDYYTNDGPMSCYSLSVSSQMTIIIIPWRLGALQSVKVKCDNLSVIPIGARPGGNQRPPWCGAHIQQEEGTALIRLIFHKPEVGR